MRLSLIACGFLMAASMLAAAQVNPVAGNLPFATQVGGPYDHVDLATSNILLTIPLRAKSEKIPFSFSLVGNSVAFSYPYNPGHGPILYQWNTLFSIQGSESREVYVTSSTNTITCNGNSNDTQSYAFVVHDASGTAHPLPANIKVDNDGCDPLPATGVAVDGSGYTMEITSGTIDNFYVWDKTGTQVFNNFTGVVTDPDGATESGPCSQGCGAGAYKDSLNTTAMNVSLGCCSGPPDKYTYTGGDGNTDGATVSYTEYHVLTVFGCSGMTEMNDPTYLPGSVSITGLGTFTIGYETTPGYSGQKDSNGLSYVTGRIGSITYPMGGSVTYSYSGGNNGVNCKTQIVPTLTRSVYDNYSKTTSTWTYVNNNTTTPTNNFTIVETDPAGNQTIRSFAQEYETLIQSYQGGCPTSTNGCNGSGTLAKSVNTCYGGNGSTPPAPPNCTTPTSTPVLPITETDVYTSIGGSSTNRVNTTFDSYGNVTSVLAYNFGGTPLLSATYTSYGQSWNGTTCTAYSSGYIRNTPCYRHTENSSGADVAKTQITYSSAGHPTSTQKWTSGSSWLTSGATYNSNGTPNVVTDVNSTTYTYAYNGTDGCNSLLPTSVTIAGKGLPSAGLVNTTEWNCNGGVVTETLDPNNRATNYAHDDPLWRATAMTDAMSHTTTYSYTPTTFESVLNFNGTISTVDTLTTTDGLGRPIYSQRRQSPSSNNYDSVQKSYGWTTTTSTIVGGPLTKTTMAYVETAGQAAPGGTAATTTQDDALGRPYTITDGAGGTTSYNYVQNDVLVTTGPSPQTFQKQLQFDALGRLTFVCEINSLSGSGGCGQSNPANGFQTTYTYDPLGNLLTVTQNEQPNHVGGTQSRSYTYDGLSRLTSESNPESGTATYLYDSLPGVAQQPGACSTQPVSFPGQLTLSTGANGDTVCYLYDGLNRITDMNGESPAGSNSSCKRFRYDNSQGVKGSIPDGISPLNPYERMVEAETDNCIGGPVITDEWFSYDADGRTLDYYQSSPSSGGYYHASYGPNYYANGAVGTLNLYNGSGTALFPTQTYGLDGEGRIYSVSASSGSNPVASTNYVNANGVGEPVGAITNVNFGSGDSDQFAYQTTTGRMSQYTFNVNGQSAVGSLTWNLNGTLQQLAITDPFNSEDGQTCTYSYDALSRITGNNCTSNPAFAQTFSYDAFGNISKSGSIAWLPGYNNPTNQYVTPQNCATNGGAPCYDASGNLLNDTFNTYTWDGYGGLASVNGAAVTNDAFGRMVENQSRGLEVLYSSASAPVLAVAQGATLNTAFVPLPGGITAAYANGGAFEFLDPDWLGSVRLLTATGRNAYPMMAYAPFGEGYAGGTPGNYEFTAGGYGFTVLDSEGDSGTLADFMFRRYSPTQGRWISPDPAGLAAVDPSNPQSWNRYAYVYNNPLSNVDPSGLACYPLEKALFGSCSGFEGNGVDFGEDWNEFDLLEMAFAPTSYRFSGYTLMGLTNDGSILLGQDATDAYLQGDTFYTNEIATYQAIYGNIGLLSVMFGVGQPATNVGTPQKQQAPSKNAQQPLPLWMTFKLANHSDPPIQPTCKSAGFLGVEIGLGVGPWVEGPLSWAAYFGGNALGIYTLAKC